MTLTKKFSQFNGPDPIQSTDIVVGLRVGPNGLDNWQFTGVGSGGGGGGVTETITQPGQTFVAGNWVRIDVATAVYVLAQADTTSDAEVIGVVISSNIPAGTFVLQQSGYITTAQAVVSGLTTGVPQFLSTSSPGAMQPMDVTADGQISRPLFVPDSPTSGWVIPYRGIITDGGPNTGTSSPSPGGSDSNIITVTQNGHPFNPGDVVYVITPVGGQATYDFAKADNFATSQAVGVVIEKINANQFMLQFSGYNLQGGGVGGITVDDMGNPVVASTVYYLSPTNAGRVTSFNPAGLGTYSRPIFVSERTNLTSGVYSGWILPQRPLDQSPTGAQNSVVHTVIQGNAFVPGNFLYISADGTYALASAATLAQAQVAGVVLTASAPKFTIQQAGWITGAVTHVNVDGGVINSAVVYYLSAINPGNLTALVPGVGTISKPCYVQETAGTSTGEILPQRPLLVSAPGGGGGLVYLATRTAANNIVNFDNCFSATYDDYLIVMENMYSGGFLAAQIGTGAGPVYQNTNYLDQSHNPLTNSAMKIGLLNSLSATNTQNGNLYIYGTNNVANSKNFLCYTLQYGSGTVSTNNQGALWIGASAISSIRIFSSDGSFTPSPLITGTFKLYGISKS